MKDLKEEHIKLEVDSDIKNLELVKNFMKDTLSEIECSDEQIMRIFLALEEIFMNVCSYAYNQKQGKVIVDMSFNNDKSIVYITIIDMGEPFNPLERDEIDVESHVKNRQVGGLGIFLAGSIMDSMSYEYKDHENRLTLEKKLIYS